MPTNTLKPGASLRIARETTGLTRPQLAERLGWTLQRLTNLENDCDLISLAKLLQVATAIGCNAKTTRKLTEGWVRFTSEKKMVKKT